MPSNNTSDSKRMKCSTIQSTVTPASNPHQCTRLGGPPGLHHVTSYLSRSWIWLKCSGFHGFCTLFTAIYTVKSNREISKNVLYFLPWFESVKLSINRTSIFALEATLCKSLMDASFFLLFFGSIFSCRCSERAALFGHSLKRIWLLNRATWSKSTNSFRTFLYLEEIHRSLCGDYSQCTTWYVIS